MKVLSLSTVKKKIDVVAVNRSEYSMPWTREETKNWIVQLENRLEDINYYLNETVKWCENNEIYDNQIVFTCSIMTVVWVSHMRGEPLSKREALELVGVENIEKVQDDVYMLGELFQDCDHEELLSAVVSRFY
jgi:hypothetical protein